MSNTSTAPFPYKNAYIDQLEATSDSYSGLMEFRGGKSLPSIKSDTYEAWRLLEPLLAGIQMVARDKGPEATYGTVARLEFVWDASGDEEFRGVAIFDVNGRLVVHAQHALLGYSGSGPLLSLQIMKQLGITEEMYDDIQRSVWDQRPYTVVISREKHDVIDGVDTAYPTLDVESQWNWWRVR